MIAPLALIGLLSLPVIVITFGIALFFINMAMLALTAWIVSGFEVGGFWSLASGTTSASSTSNGL